MGNEKRMKGRERRKVKRRITQDKLKFCSEEKP
jgi:hypothetical protein